MVNVAIAGCGSITRQRHAPEYSQNRDCIITGFYDFVPLRSQELVDQYGGKVYQTFEEMLADDLVDAVSICTANAFHVPMSIQALQAGKHVLCEKPMASTVEEAEAVLTAVKASGKYFMIGHNQRLTPAHVQAEQLLRQGEIEDVDFYSVHPGRMNTEMGRTTAQIEPQESAEGFYKLMTGETPISRNEWYINYKGEPMAY